MLGIEVSRYKKPSKTKRTNELSLYSTKTGKYYLPKDSHEDIVANTIINNKIFEEEIVDSARTYIQRDSSVLDVGANFGQMSILFASMVGQKGKVYSFDADDFVFDILKRNIAVNNINNIIPIFGAVHYLTGKTLFFPEQDFEKWGTYGSYGIDYNAKNGRKVKSLTIDSLEIKEKISFMKVDIQGGDLFALKGAVESIKKNKMPIIFEFEWNFQDEFNLSFQEYVDFVLSIGYRFRKVILGHNYLITPNV
jgi:FkbM family methyltransferase